MSLADVRKLARKAFAQVAEGRDPSTEKRERRDGGKADSFRAVAAECLERYAKRHKAGALMAGGRAADRPGAFAQVGAPEGLARSPRPTC